MEKELIKMRRICVSCNNPTVTERELTEESINLLCDNNGWEISVENGNTVLNNTHTCKGCMEDFYGD